MMGDEICGLFNKLAGFLKCPATFIFVYDGPGRPKVKRGHRVIQKEPRWTKASKILIRYFGYYSWDVRYCDSFLFIQTIVDSD